MLLGEDSGPVVLAVARSPFWRSSVAHTELGLTHTVHNNNSVLCIMWTQARLSALERWFLSSCGRRICPCACCQRLCQHIFDHHSNIFFADVALDKLCMTSSQKVWQRPKCLKASGCSQTLLCCPNFNVSFLQMCDLQLTLTRNKWLYLNPLCLLPPFLALTPRSLHLCKHHPDERAGRQQRPSAGDGWQFEARLLFCAGGVWCMGLQNDL